MSQDNKTNVRIASKMDTKARLTEYNPVLLDKEVVYERDTGRYKIGDGTKTWNELPYFGEITEKAYTINFSEIHTTKLHELKEQGYTTFLILKDLNIIIDIDTEPNEQGEIYPIDLPTDIKLISPNYSSTPSIIFSCNEIIDGYISYQKLSCTNLSIALLGRSAIISDIRDCIFNNCQISFSDEFELYSNNIFNNCELGSLIFYIQAKNNVFNNCIMDQTVLNFDKEYECCIINNSTIKNLVYYVTDETEINNNLQIYGSLIKTLPEEQYSQIKNCCVNSIISDNNPQQSAFFVCDSDSLSGADLEILSEANRNQLWIDTNSINGGLKYYNGINWVHVPVAYA